MNNKFISSYNFFNYMNDITCDDYYSMYAKEIKNDIIKTYHMNTANMNTN